MELFKITKSKYSPCSLTSFKVKGKDAELSDFGEMKDVNKEHAEPYACKCMKFILTRIFRQNILDKYNITYAEFFEIGEALEDALFVGECGYCV